MFKFRVLGPFGGLSPPNPPMASRLGPEQWVRLRLLTRFVIEMDLKQRINREWQSEH